MSGTFPSSPAPRSATLGGIQPALVSRARSGKAQRRRKGSRIWTLEAEWPPLKPADWAPLYAFLMAQDGQYGTFQWVMPGWPGSGVASGGSWAGTPVVDGASQVGTTLNIKGLTPSATGIAKAGDLFKLAGSTKVYMITADADADGAGKAALAIRGPLIASPADAETITHSSVPLTVALTEDAQKLAYGLKRYGTLSMSAVESW